MYRYSVRPTLWSALSQMTRASAEIWAGYREARRQRARTRRAIARSPYAIALRPRWRLDTLHVVAVALVVIAVLALVADGLFGVLGGLGLGQLWAGVTK